MFEDIKDVIFFCHYGNGDIFESREFIKEYIKRLPNRNYYYAHGKQPYILNDMLDTVKYTTVTEEMNHRKSIFQSGNTLYINTWIGRDSKYVLPGIGCVVEKHYEMHNDMMKEAGLGGMTGDIYEYIPSVNWNKFHIENIFNFFNYKKLDSKNCVLISNGPVQSNQAENFDMTSAILSIAEKYPNLTIFVTQQMPVDLGTKYPNIYYTDTLTGTSGCDLNEIGYLSSFCDTIIGRNSGPHVFSQHLSNWMNHNKKCLSFTYNRIASHFVLSNSLPMRKFWSPVINPSLVSGVMEEVINA